MQFKVPQNIDKEDQIVGPLTLTQFSYLAIGGALDVLINQATHGALRVLIIGVISIIALSFAFLKIQDRPLLYFVAAAIHFALQPKMRVWHKMNDRPVLQMQQKPQVTAASTPQKKALDPQELAQVTKAVDTRGHLEKQPTPSPAVNTPSVPFENVDTSRLG